MSRSNIRSAIGSRSCVFWALAWKIPCLTRLRCGCSGKRWPRQDWSSHYLSASISTSMRRAISPVAGRLSMPPSSTRPSSTTPGKRTRRSKRVRRRAQKDKDARWTKKNDQSFYGYKNHVSVDRKHKIIRRYAETDASVHDSQKLDEVLDKSNTSNEVWADSAYRSAETEAKLKEQGYKSRIHRRSVRNHTLSERQQAANTTRSRVRARVEHVFADQENGMGGIFVRIVGMARAAAKIGMMNLVYNMRRLVWLERVAAAPA